MRKYIVLYLIVLFATSTTMAKKSSPSQIVIDSIQSKTLNTYRTYSILLPARYDEQTDHKYPILYLLHGMWDKNQCWAQKGDLLEVYNRLLASDEIDEMIIVTPNAGGNLFAGEINGYFNMPNWQYETFFFNEFMPYIESTYRIKTDKRHRAIAGLSMGGGGSVSYAQHHSDVFGSVYAMSASMSLEGRDKIDENTELDILRKDLDKSIEENDCTKFITNADPSTIKQLQSIRWFIDCGDDDFLFNGNVYFVQAMKKASIPYQFRVRDGGHDWEYWHSALYICLPFVNRGFEKLQ
ncbi:MAG: esterase family protein [Bacteroidia bacterium]|nr:esterase family protein [Bacteroidia bacterium]